MSEHTHKTARWEGRHSWFGGQFYHVGICECGSDATLPTFGMTEEEDFYLGEEDGE